MASREEYTTCMTPFMKGSGKTREERQTSMCIGAKLCSGKASNEQEAQKLCAEAALEPKPARVSRGKRGCKIDYAALATCTSKNIDPETITPESFLESLETAFQKCQAIQAAPSYKKFMKECVLVNTVTGTLPESNKLIKQCNTEWKEIKK